MFTTLVGGQSNVTRSIHRGTQDHRRNRRGARQGRKPGSAHWRKAMARQALSAKPISVAIVVRTLLSLSDLGEGIDRYGVSPAPDWNWLAMAHDRANQHKSGKANLVFDREVGNNRRDKACKDCTNVIVQATCRLKAVSVGCALESENARSSRPELNPGSLYRRNLGLQIRSRSISVYCKYAGARSPPR
jgi:hypothetical protein